MLLNLKDEGVLVTKGAQLRGRSGVFHQIDVYYEFERAGIRHKVAIECKATKRAIELGDVRNFSSTLQDIGNVNGIMVSRNGFQEGASDFAGHNGIELLTDESLPTIPLLFGKRLEAVALPDETYVGEPFWTIMELRDNRVTGSYFAYSDPSTGQRQVPLTYCKVHAERALLEAGLSPKEWTVRGLPRHSLRGFIIMLDLFEMHGNGAVILYLPPGSKEDADFIGMNISREDLIKEYYGAAVPRLGDGQ